MFDINLPQAALTGDVADIGANMGANIGASFAAKIRGPAYALITVLGIYVSVKGAIAIIKEWKGESPVRHEVTHRGEPGVGK